MLNICNRLLNVSSDHVVFIADLFYKWQEAQDYGGPRKDFFRLVLMEIKRTCFDHGLRELMREKYFLIGIILGR